MRLLAATTGMSVFAGTAPEIPRRHTFDGSLIGTYGRLVPT